MKTSGITVEEQYAGVRLDKVLTHYFSEHTRSYFQHLLESGSVKVNGKSVKASYTVKSGDKVEVSFPTPKELLVEPKNIPLDIVYEDPNILVINKPAGLVVHPGTHGSHSDDSLVNAILYHCKTLKDTSKGSLSGINGVVRPGIVHRLDKDTSGLLVVAKNDAAQQFMMEQFQEKTVQKVYYALVVGHLEPEQGTIDAPIGRSLHDRKKMAVVQGKTSKEAVTKYEVVRYYGDYSYVKVHLLTGRTHQIRVHFAAIGFPLVGDRTYGRAKTNHSFEKHYGLQRQFLHATELSFMIPPAGRNKRSKKGEFESPLPLDLQRVLDGLSREASTVNR